MPAPRSDDLKPRRHDSRRSDVRYSLRAPGLIADEAAFYDCIVADVSVGGAMLEGELPLPVGRQIALGFDTVMGVIGEVVHRGDGFVGVKFVGGDGERRMMVGWIRARLRDARADEPS